MSVGGGGDSADVSAGDVLGQSGRYLGQVRGGGEGEFAGLCAEYLQAGGNVLFFFYHTVIHNLKKIVEMNVKHSMYDNIFEIESQQV